MHFEIDPKPLGEELTALGGVPLVVRAFRSLGLPAAIQEHVHIKQRERGYDEATYVESLVVLNAVGGECPEDLERLREDAALSKLLGHDFPSPRATLEFLYQFHDEQKMEEAKGRRAPDEIAYIPEESAELQGLGRVNRSLVQELGSRCAEQRIATVDQDATIIESRKQEALRTYEPEEAWKPYGEPQAEEIRECAEVPFVPGEKSEHKQTEPLSRLAGWGFGFASGRAVCLRAVLPPGILRC